MPKGPFRSFNSAVNAVGRLLGSNGFDKSVLGEYSDELRIEGDNKDKFYTDNDAKDYKRSRETAAILFEGIGGKDKMISFSESSFNKDKYFPENGGITIDKALKGMLSDQKSTDRNMKGVEQIDGLMVHNGVNIAMQSLLGVAMDARLKQKPDMMSAIGGSAKLDLFVFTEEHGLEFFSLMISSRVMVDVRPVVYDANSKCFDLAEMDLEDPNVLDQNSDLTKRLHKYVKNKTKAPDVPNAPNERVRDWLERLQKDGAKAEDWKDFNKFGVNHQALVIDVTKVSLDKEGVPVISVRGGTSPLLGREKVELGDRSDQKTYTTLEKLREVYQEITGEDIAPRAYGEKELIGSIVDEMLDEYDEEESISDYEEITKLIESSVESLVSEEITIGEFRGEVKEMIDRAMLGDFYDELTASNVARQIQSSNNNVGNSNNSNEQRDLNGDKGFGNQL